MEEIFSREDLTARPMLEETDDNPGEELELVLEGIISPEDRQRLDQTNTTVAEMSERLGKEAKAIENSITRTSIDHRFILDAQHSATVLNGVKITEAGENELVFFGAGGRGYEFINFDTHLSDIGLLEDRGNIDHLTLSPWHHTSFAVSYEGNPSKMYTGDLNNVSESREIEIAESTSFGFLNSGDLVYLDSEGKIIVGDEYASLNGERKRWIRKDLILPYEKIQVLGSLILAEYVALDIEHETWRSQPAIYIGSPPSDLNQKRYNRHQRVFDITQTPSLVFSASKNFTADEMERRFKTTIPTDLHGAGYISHVKSTRRPMEDMWGSGPMYDNLMVIDPLNPDKPVYSGKIDMRKVVSTEAITINKDGSLAFIGKYDGTVQVEPLNSSKDPSNEFSREFSASTNSNRSIASFSIETHGDPYFYRKPPKEILEFTASDKPIISMHWRAGKLVSVDQEGVVKAWKVTS